MRRAYFVFAPAAVLVLIMSSPATASGPAASATKFSPLKAYTVVYKVSGAQNGTVTQYSRQYGLEQSQVNDLALGNGARNRVHLITRGASITSYDPDTRRAGTTANPGYQTLRAAVNGKGDTDLPGALLKVLGFTPTGRMDQIAGEPCMVWDSSALSQTRCVSADGIALRVHLAVPGADITQTAIKVSRGDPGPGAVYAVPTGIAIAPVSGMGALPGVGR